MEIHVVESRLNEILENLAALEHARWAHWQRYVHASGQNMPDGSIIIPPILVHRWEAQISKTYSQLTESEKESDREQVRKYLPLIAEALSKG